MEKKKQKKSKKQKTKKQQVEITMRNSIYKTNIKCIRCQVTNTEQVIKYRYEICLSDLQSNFVNFNICLKIIALKAF